MDLLNYIKQTGGSASSTAPTKSNTDDSFLTYLKNEYNINNNVQTEQPAQTVQKAIPSLAPSNTTPTQLNAPRDVISEYESMPNYNLFERLTDKTKWQSYNDKSALQPEYESAKKEANAKLLQSIGLTADDVTRKGPSASNEDARITKLLQSKGLSKEQINDIKKYGAVNLQEKANENLTNFADEHKILGTVASTLLKPGAAITGSITNTADYLSGKPLTNTSEANALTKTVGDMRETVSEDFGDVGKFAYGMGTSLLDMVANAVFGSGYAGLSAMQESAVKNIAKGLTPTQTYMTALVNGGAEMALEKIPLGQLRKLAEGVGVEAGAKGLAKAILASMGAEAIEEGGTDIVNDFADVLINKDKSDFKMSIDMYRRNGMSKDEATKQALIDAVKEVAMDSLAGALTGGVMGLTSAGVGKIKSDINTRRINKGYEEAENIWNNMEAEKQAKVDEANNLSAMANRMAEENNASENGDLNKYLNAFKSQQDAEANARAQAENDARLEQLRQQRFAEERGNQEDLSSLLEQASQIPNKPNTVAELVKETKPSVDARLSELGANLPEADRAKMKNVQHAIDTYFETGKLFNVQAAYIEVTRNMSDTPARTELALYLGDLITEQIDNPNSPYGRMDDLQAEKENNRVNYPKLENDVPLRTEPTYSPETFANPYIPRLEQPQVEIQQQEQPKQKRNKKARTTYEENAAMHNANTNTSQFVEPDVPQGETSGRANSATWGKGEEAMNSYANDTVYRSDVSEDVLNELAPQYYNVAKNSDTKAEAQRIMEENKDNPSRAYAIFRARLKSHDPVAVPLGAYLTKTLSPELASEVVESLSTELTKAGQFTQAAAIELLKSNPVSAMNYLENQIAKLNEEGRKRYHNKWSDMELTIEEMEAFQSIDPGDAEAIGQLYNQITDRLAKQYPSTLWDKIVEGSKLSMLFNPATHITNSLANLIMKPISSVTDRIQAIGERAYKAIIDNDYEVTQSLVGGTREQKDIAENIYKEQIEKRLDDAVNKYMDITKNKLGDTVTKKRQVFSNSAVGKLSKDVTMGIMRTVNGMTNGKLDNIVANLDANTTESVLENLREFDYWLLGKAEDDPFVKMRFVDRLASYMKAQNINSAEAIPQEAIEIAYDEALKATFKDNNRMTQSLGNIKKNAGKFGDVLFPFVKTPANIAVRGLEYSPVGIAMSLTNSYKQNGAEGVGKMLTDPVFAKGILGTLGIYAGFLMARAGILGGALSDDKKERAFEKAQGKTEFSIKIGNEYVPISWAQPAAIPLIIGAAINDAIENDEKEKSSIALQGAYAGINTWMSLSPLQTFADLFKTDPYTGNVNVGKNAIETITEFPQRLIPAVVGQTARATDNRFRETYDSTSTMNTLINQTKAKIPFLDDTLPVQYDQWGNERVRQDSKAFGALDQFALPGSYSQARENAFDKDLIKLGVYPSSVDYSVKVNGETKKLNSKEHSEYARVKGEYNYKLANEFYNSPEYKTLSDSVKKEVFSELFSLANTMAVNELFGNEISNNVKKKYNVYKEDGADGLVTYLSTKESISEALGTNPKTRDIIPVLDKTSMTDAEKGKYFSQSISEPFEKAVPFLEDEDYENFYNAYKIKYGADVDGNNLSQEELIKYLKNSDMSIQDKYYWFKVFYPTSKTKPVLY